MSFFTAGLISAIEAVEDMGLFLLGNSYAVVGYLNAVGSAVISEGQADLSLGRGVADCIVQQDREYLTDASGIAGAGGKGAFRKPDGEFDGFLGGYGLKGFIGLQKEGVQLRGAGFYGPGVGLHARQKEHIVDEAGHAHSL